VSALRMVQTGNSHFNLIDRENKTFEARTHYYFPAKADGEIHRVNELKCEGIELTDNFDSKYYCWYKPASMTGFIRCTADQSAGSFNKYGYFDKKGIWNFHCGKVISGKFELYSDQYDKENPYAFVVSNSDDGKNVVFRTGYYSADGSWNDYLVSPKRYPDSYGLYEKSTDGYHFAFSNFKTPVKTKYEKIVPRYTKIYVETPVGLTLKLDEDLWSSITIQDILGRVGGMIDDKSKVHIMGISSKGGFKHRFMLQLGMKEKEKSLQEEEWKEINKQWKELNKLKIKPLQLKYNNNVLEPQSELQSHQIENKSILVLEIVGESKMFKQANTNKVGFLLPEYPIAANKHQIILEPSSYTKHQYDAHDSNRSQSNVVESVQRGESGQIQSLKNPNAVQQNGEEAPTVPLNTYADPHLESIEVRERRVAVTKLRQLSKGAREQIRKQRQIRLLKAQNVKEESKNGNIIQTKVQADHTKFKCAHGPGRLAPIGRLARIDEPACQSALSLCKTDGNNEITVMIDEAKGVKFPFSCAVPVHNFLHRGSQNVYHFKCRALWHCSGEREFLQKFGKKTYHGDEGGSGSLAGGSKRGSRDCTKVGWLEGWITRGKHQVTGRADFRIVVQTLKTQY